MKSMPKTQEHESFDSPEEDPASSTIKNMETTQVLSWIKLKPNPKLLDFVKKILMRSKSLLKH